MANDVAPKEGASLTVFGLQTLSTLALRAFQLGALLLTTLVLARVLGPVEFGAYSYASSWLALLAGFATVGFTHASVREVAHALALGRHAEARSHIVTAYATTLAAGVLAVAVVLLAQGRLLATGVGMAGAASIGVALTPLLALLLVAQAVLRGQGFSVRAQVAELLILPSFMLLVTVWLGLAGPSWRTADRALYLYGACLFVALLIGLALQWRAPPAELRQGGARVDPKWMVAALPFVLVLVSVTISGQFDVLTVGGMRGATETGVYALAARLSLMPAVVLTAVGTPLSPAIAALYAKRESAELERLVAVAALVGALGSTAVAVCVLVGAPWLTRLINPTFEAGGSALLILCLGRVVEAWFGPGGLVLAMTRHAWPAGIAVAIGAVASVALNLLLVGPYGIEGAAIATAASCLLRGFAMWYWVRKYEGVRASAIEALFSVARRGPAPRASRPPAS
jgi:O-antigen/teichoic acid export membrane protein